jgi:hypothetical protein
VTPKGQGFLNQCSKIKSSLYGQTRKATDDLSLGGLSYRGGSGRDLQSLSRQGSEEVTEGELGAPARWMSALKLACRAGGGGRSSLPLHLLRPVRVGRRPPHPTQTYTCTHSSGASTLRVLPTQGAESPEICSGLFLQTQQLPGSPQLPPWILDSPSIQQVLMKSFPGTVSPRTPTHEP